MTSGPVGRGHCEGKQGGWNYPQQTILKNNFWLLEQSAEYCAAWQSKPQSLDLHKAKRTCI